MTRTAALFLGSALLFTGACKKKEPETAVIESTGPVLKGAMVPDTENAKGFARNMVTHDAAWIRPTDGAGASFQYKSIKFTPENNGWSAEAVMGDGAESVACTEIGSWEIQEADSENSAIVALKMNKTTCAGRPETSTMRMKINIDATGKYTVEMR